MFVILRFAKMRSAFRAYFSHMGTVMASPFKNFQSFSLPFHILVIAGIFICPILSTFLRQIFPEIIQVFLVSTIITFLGLFFLLCYCFNLFHNLLHNSSTGNCEKQGPNSSHNNLSTQSNSRNSKRSHQILTIIITSCWKINLFTLWHHHLDLFSKKFYKKNNMENGTLRKISFLHTCYDSYIIHEQYASSSELG